MKIKGYILYTVLLSAFMVSSCTMGKLEFPSPVNGDLTLNLITDGLLTRYNVTTKGNDNKTMEEQKITNLHVFIFDADGNYLEADDQHRYQGYRSITGGATVMNIDRQGWADNGKAENATVVAVANVETGTFKFDEQSSADTPPENVANLSELLGLVYDPTSEPMRDVTSMPKDGLPMFKMISGVNLTASNPNQSIDIQMRSLMARVDISIQIAAEQAGELPELTITGARVLNAPTAVTLLEDLDETTVTDTDDVGLKDFDIRLTGELNTIRNGRGVFEKTFYVFENLQLPGYEEYPLPYPYPDPEDMEDWQKQRYKPELAGVNKDKALAFEFTGNFIDIHGISYTATYTLYLGANHTDDFKVKRNRQYKNAITIKGIDVAMNDETNHVTFDARVDVSESNPYFISLLKAYSLDCHFNVAPMDVYFFQPNPSNPVSQKIKIEIENSDAVNWVRMEKISGEDMADGSLDSDKNSSTVQANSNDHIIKSGEFVAGHGKRKYFTTDLVSNTLAGNTSVELESNRDRVYLYVDECLDYWEPGDAASNMKRQAKLRVTYYENDAQTGAVEELLLEQSKLLKVTFHSSEDDDDGIYVDGKEWTAANGVIYIEAYEEYLDHGDPLNEYSSNQVFTEGLPWGANGWEIGEQQVGTGRLGIMGVYKNCQDNFWWGHVFTQAIVNKSEHNGDICLLTLDEKPETAAGYCYNKNKRNNDGTVSNPKWYLPGIRELERILEDYYTQYTEFQDYYYWSSAAGEGYREGYYLWEDDWVLTGDENNNQARATKAYIGPDENGNPTYKYYESGALESGEPRIMYEEYGDNGESGKAMRTSLLRIRAARIDNQPQ